MKPQPHFSLPERIRRKKVRARKQVKYRVRENVNPISPATLKSFYVQSWNACQAVREWGQLELVRVELKNRNLQEYMATLRNEGKLTPAKRKWCANQTSRLSARKKIWQSRMKTLRSEQDTFLSLLNKTKVLDQIIESVKPLAKARPIMVRRERYMNRVKEWWEQTEKIRPLTKEELVHVYTVHLRFIIPTLAFLRKQQKFIREWRVTFTERRKVDVNATILKLEGLKEQLMAQLKDLQGPDDGDIPLPA